MLGVPLAASYEALGDVPARLVDDVSYFKIGRSRGESEKPPTSPHGIAKAKSKANVRADLRARKRGSGGR